MYPHLTLDILIEQIRQFGMNIFGVKKILKNSNQSKMKFKPLLFSLLILAGCVNVPSFNDDQGIKWYKKYQAIPVANWTYIYTSDVEVFCGMGKLACAKMYHSAQLCTIILPKNAPQWLVRHEERHCEGWWHD